MNAKGYKGRFFTEAEPLLYVPFSIPDALRHNDAKGLNAAEALNECLSAAMLSAGFTNKNQKPTEHIVRSLNISNNIKGDPTGLISLRIASGEKLGKRGMHQRLEAVDAELLDPARICDVYLPDSVHIPDGWGNVVNHQTPIMNFNRIQLKRELVSSLSAKQTKQVTQPADISSAAPAA